MRLSETWFLQTAIPGAQRQQKFLLMKEIGSTTKTFNIRKKT
jgi:hypothetical protein